MSCRSCGVRYWNGMCEDSTMSHSKSKLTVERIKNLVLKDNFSLSVRLMNILQNWNIKTLYDLTRQSEDCSSYGLVHSPIQYGLVKNILEPLELKLVMTDTDWAEWEKTHKVYDFGNL